MITRSLISQMIAGAALSLALPSVCDAQEQGVFVNLKPLPYDILARERGGFIVANGIEFGFSATLQTAVNGSVVMTTQLALQDNNSVTSQTSINTNLNTGGGGPVTVTPVSGGAQLSSATGLDLSGVQGNGVVIKSSSGVTAVVNNSTANQLQNVVVNTANNQTVTQSTNLTLTLPGYTTTMNQFQGAQIASSLTNALQAAQLYRAH